MCWFSVKMTARLDVNATPGVRMSPLAPGIVPECSGASRVKRAARAGFAALDSPCALWYSFGVVALSPSTTYRVLSKAGRLDRWNGKPSKKGTGFVQPLRPHQHWHTDISYLNLGGTFYYLCSFLDGASRAVVHWEIRESMTEADVECILERAKELYPDARPRIISDNISSLLPYIF